MISIRITHKICNLVLQIFSYSVMKFFSGRFRKSKKINEDFVRSEAEQIQENDIETVVENSERIESTISKSNRFDSVLSEAKLMLSLINDYRSKKYAKVPWFTIAAVVSTLLYILNPMDIIPDYIPFVGFVDCFEYG